MRKGLLLLLLLAMLTLLNSSGLAAQETPGPAQRTRLVANLLAIDPGPDHDWNSHEVELGEVVLPAAAPEAMQRTANGEWAYVIYDALVVIYPNTAAGSISAAQVERVKEQVRTARDFFWRNSHFKFYLNVEFLVINDYVDGTEFRSPWSCGWLWPNDDYDGDGEAPEADLLGRGINTADYDSINLIWAHNNGKIGACAGGLTWLYGWNWYDSGHTALTTNALIFAYGDDVWNPFHHEFQHSIEGALRLNNNYDYFAPDYPWQEPYRFGENWHYHAVQMRAWPLDDWFDLLGEWGRMGIAPDADEDALPDGGELPVTEATVGSSPTTVDSEGDGLTDRDEAMAGMFRASDPIAADSDGDGQVDGDDAYPLYALKTYIPRKEMLINGSPSGWTLLTASVTEADVPFAAEAYASWSSGNLYLMVVSDGHALVDIMLDGNGDGYFHGRDNYQFQIDTNSTGGTSPLIYVGVNDCSARQTSAKSYCQYDSDSSYSFGRLVSPADFEVKAVAEEGRHIVQLRIPADSDTQFSPAYGDEVGLRFYFADVGNVWRQEAWSFEFDEQVYLPLLTDDTGWLRGQVTGLGPCDEGSDPIAGIDVTVQGAKGPLYRAPTDAEGRYSLPLRAINEPYTTTVDTPDYVVSVVSEIAIVPQGETVQDLTLRYDAPCLAVAPPAISETLRLGEVITRQLVIDNSGAGLGDITTLISDYAPPVTTWVVTDPLTGTIPAGAALSLDVILDARSGALAEPGLYEATLTVRDLGATAQETAVPLSLNAVTYGVSLETEQAAGEGMPGSSAGYTLLLTNKGTTSDTFDLSASGGWPVQMPDTVGPLAAGEQQAVAASVAIPVSAKLGESEVTTITAVSRAAPDMSAVLLLDTEVNGMRIALPVIMR